MLISILIGLVVCIGAAFIFYLLGLVYWMLSKKWNIFLAVDDDMPFFDVFLAGLLNSLFIGLFGCTFLFLIYQVGSLVRMVL